VVHDDVQIGYLGTEHLIMLGHKRICFACTGGNDVPGNNHLRGYRTALADYGIEYRPELVITHPINQCAEPTQRSVEVLLRENPRAFTAIATSQFSMTYGILKALSNLGLKCPDDIALVGANVYQNPELSFVTHTLQQDHRMGVEAMKVLVAEGGRGRKRHVLLEPELVIGTTCGGKRK
jgi:DNA-binding LacI/PurR family transcriptional regulator